MFGITARIRNSLLKGNGRVCGILRPRHLPQIHTVEPLNSKTEVELADDLERRLVSASIADTCLYVVQTHGCYQKRSEIFPS
jgi:hypothetical protein